MPKKSLIKEALIEAQEIERASIENAKDIVLEAYAPNFVDFFKSVLNESDDEDEDDTPFDSDEDEDEEDESEELDEDSDRDEGKEPDAGRDEDTDPSPEEEKELSERRRARKLKESRRRARLRREGEYDDVSGDATPEKGQAGLPRGDKPKVKQTGKEGWEAGEGENKFRPNRPSSEDPEKNDSQIPGKMPSTKETDEGWEEEHEGGSKYADTDNAVPSREKLAGTPSAKVVEESDDDDEDDEELDEMYIYEEDDEEDSEDDSTDYDEDGEEDQESLEVPDELFDDEDDEEAEGEDEDDDVDLKDDFDGDDDEIEIDIEDDDDEEDSVNEEEDADGESDEEDDDESEDDDEDEEVNEGLYIRRGDGKFKKITPAEYLKTRITTLESENKSLKQTLKTLRGQLQETNLFNAKLAHMNKLTISGMFTVSEKSRIAERLDECESVSDVKNLYKTIIKEVKNSNPLDGFAETIKEHRVRNGSKTENVYESTDIQRMKRIMDYKFNK